MILAACETAMAGGVGMCSLTVKALAVGSRSCRVDDLLVAFAADVEGTLMGSYIIL